MRSVFSTLCVFCLVSAMSGCPDSLPVPPFDTTGAYMGTWEGQYVETKQAIECDLDLTLTQNVSAAFPQDFAVSGMATVDLTCTDLGDVLTQFNQPTVQMIPVNGIQAADGNLILANGNCPPGFCVLLVFGGLGEDTDEDGSMDAYSGDWSFTIFPPGLQSIVYEGTFDVAKAVATE